MVCHAASPWVIFDVRYVSDASRAALSYFRRRTSSSTHQRFEELKSSLPDLPACSCPVFTSTSTAFRCSLCKRSWCSILACMTAARRAENVDARRPGPVFDEGASNGLVFFV